MTKKHFEWAAREIAEDRIVGTYGTRESRAVVRFCMTMFSHFNSRFDRDRFQARIDQLVFAGIERKQLKPVQRGTVARFTVVQS